MYIKEHQDLHSTSAKKSRPTKTDSNFKRNGLLCRTTEVECYKIFLGFYHLTLKLTFFDFATTWCTKANPAYKLYVNPTRLEIVVDYIFFTSIVQLWNELYWKLIPVSI